MEVSDKDVYSYIVNLAEDKDVVNMLSVNRKFNDDSYFKQILENRYPLLLRFKKHDETYKQFYLKMIKYIAKLWEEFEVPYIPVKGFDPPDIYALVKAGFTSIYYALLPLAIKVGDVKIVKHLLNKGAKIDYAALEAAAKQSLNILKILLDNTSLPNSWLQYTLKNAKEENNRPVIDFLETKCIN